MVGQEYLAEDWVTAERKVCGGFQLSQYFAGPDREAMLWRILPEAAVVAAGGAATVEYSAGVNLEHDRTYFGVGLCHVDAEAPKGMAEGRDASYGGYVCWGFRHARDDAPLGLLIRYVFATKLSLLGERTDADGLQVMVTIPLEKVPDW